MNLVSLTLPDIIGLIGVGFILVTFAGLTLEKMDPSSITISTCPALSLKSHG